MFGPVNSHRQYKKMMGRVQQCCDSPPQYHHDVPWLLRLGQGGGLAATPDRELVAFRVLGVDAAARLAVRAGELVLLGVLEGFERLALGLGEQAVLATVCSDTVGEQLLAGIGLQHVGARSVRRSGEADDQAGSDGVKSSLGRTQHGSSPSVAIRCLRDCIGLCTNARGYADTHNFDFRVGGARLRATTT